VGDEHNNMDLHIILFVLVNVSFPLINTYQKPPQDIGALPIRIFLGTTLAAKDRLQKFALI